VELARNLSLTEREQMFDLMGQYFLNMNWSAFLRDLGEKQWVVLVSDCAEGRVRGFSTLMQFRTHVNGQSVVVLFSGDTIVDRGFQGDMTLHRLWGRHIFTIAASIQDAPVYWFLICSGYKTYRILPIFFREFYPSYQQPTPAAVRHTLDTIARARFGPHYDAERGIVRLAHATPLRAGVADITPQRLKDPHVAFFVQANPGHAAGDELACLADISLANLTAAGRRLLGHRQAVGR
jgi:hypothetical protein